MFGQIVSLVYHHPHFSMYVLDAVDPFVLLLRCGGGDTVHHVVSFHYSPISLRLTCFNQLTTVVGDVQLEAVLERKAKGMAETITIYTKT